MAAKAATRLKLVPLSPEPPATSPLEVSYRKLVSEYADLQHKGTTSSVTITRAEYEARLPLQAMNIQRGIVGSQSQRVMEVLRLMEEKGHISGRMVRIFYEGVMGILDGEQRLYSAFERLGWKSALVSEVRTITLPPGLRGKQLMAIGFAWENGHIATLKPGDMLESLSTYVLEPLITLRTACPFLTCGTAKPSQGTWVTLPMVLRSWVSSQSIVPANASVNALTCAFNFTFADVKRLVPFLKLCYGAWHQHPRRTRLWSGANMIILGWLYLHHVQPKNPKKAALSVREFTKGLVEMANDDAYYESLKGKRATVNDRGLLYTSLITVFGRVLPTRRRLPYPDWASEST